MHEDGEYKYNRKTGPPNPGFQFKLLDLSLKKTLLSAIILMLKLDGDSIRVLEINLWLVFPDVGSNSHVAQLIGGFVDAKAIQSDTKMVNSRACRANTTPMVFQILPPGTTKVSCMDTTKNGTITTKWPLNSAITMESEKDPAKNGIPMVNNRKQSTMSTEKLMAHMNNGMKMVRGNTKVATP